MKVFTIAHLNWEGDGITALYQDDKLIMAGDYYHDKIDDRIEGFFEGLRFAGIEYMRGDVYVSGEDFDDYSAPATLTDLKVRYKWSLEPED